MIFGGSLVTLQTAEALVSGSNSVQSHCEYSVKSQGEEDSLKKKH